MNRIISVSILRSGILRRTSLIDRKRAVRLAVPAAATFLAVLSVGAAGPLLGLSRGALSLDPRAVAGFLSGLLFGWLGVSGAALGGALGAAATGASTGAALAAALAAATSAAVAFALFRYLPGVGRGLPNLRSYLWLLAASALAAAASVLHALVAGAGFLDLWAGAFVALASVAFAGPPLALAVDLWGRRWMAPIPAEVPARRTLMVSAQVRRLAEQTTQETRILSAQRPRLDWGFGVGLAALAGVTLLAVPVTSLLAVGGHWIVVLYLAPIFWAASLYGLRGAVLEASGAGFAFFAGRALWDLAVGPAGPWLTGAGLTAIYADFILFTLAGAFVGAMREREQVLRGQLVHRNRLLRHDLLRVVQALTNAVEAKDVYTEGHLKRVSDYAVRVGEAMGLAGHALEMLFFASMLHDIGKIGIPEKVLSKEGSLDLDEAQVMRRHPEIGARILQDLDVLRDAAPLVLHHQERWDGRRDGLYPGYPAGLAGSDIPLGSRIIAVVDAFDAMTTDRPYRKALGAQQAIAELRAEAGKQFDPRVVETFVEILAEHPWAAARVA